jgi:preprotein translocase subunit SecY
MKALWVSIIVVVVYRLGCLIPVPLLDRAGFDQLGWTFPDIFALGLNPFLACFLLVELYSMTPLGRSLRRGGVAGRTRLNQWALRLSIALVLVQAIGIVLYLESVVPGSWYLRPDLGPLVRLSVIATLTAGSIAVYAMARLISARGLGNGFSLIIAADILISPLRPAWTPSVYYGVPDPAILRYGFPIVLLFGLALGIFYKVSRRAVAVGKSEDEIAVKPPDFPQGTLPLAWTYLLLDRVVATLDPYFETTGFWGYQLMLVSGIVLFTWICWNLFSSPPRVEKNLGAFASGLESFNAVVKRQRTRALVVTVVFALLYATVESFVSPVWGLPIGLFGLIILVAVGVDILDELRLRRRVGPTTTLLELDNVYLATYLQGLLRREGIDSSLRAYRHRSLLFFFLPLVKMSLLVPAGDQPKAAKILEEVRSAIVVV